MPSDSISADRQLGLVKSSFVVMYRPNSTFSRAQFARRDSVYYQSLPVKAQDAFVIICTITSSPATPSQTLPRQPVPKALLDTVGSLLDDPLYSDVQFIIPNRHQSLNNARKIWASKKLLQRSEYFETSRPLNISYQLASTHAIFSV